MKNNNPDLLTVLIKNESDDNPYSYLLSNALKNERIETTSTNFPPIFPLTLEAVTKSDVDAVHLNWMYSFYMTSPTGVKPINTVLTFIRSILFLIDIFIISISNTGLFFTVHNTYNHERRFIRFERLINEFTFKFADNVTIKCKKSGEIIEKEYILADSDQFTVVPDGNYLDAYPNTIDKSTAREGLSVDPESFVYLYFGQIRHYKGVDILIDAFKELDQQDAELWVVGNPHDKKIQNDIERQAGADERITHVLKFISTDNVQEYFNMADVLILPYRTILNSGSAHLGLTFGLPVIAPRMGCIPCTVSAENERLLYDGTVDLKESMNNAYSDTDLGRLGEANYVKATNQTWKEPARQLADLYRSQ